MKKKENTKSAEKYFRRYLAIAPLGLSLWRAVEAKHLSRVELPRPILDIGCGFGEFAEAFVDEEPIDVGLDIDTKDLFNAARTKKYKNLVLADARQTPFADNTFGSIFSISTFEHIKRPEELLRESLRILKPGGKLFLTLETDEVDMNTFYRPFFARIGLKSFGEWATTRYNKLFNRHTLIPKKEWIKKVEKAGFVIETQKDIISPRITKLFDIFLITAWPSQLLYPFFGRRFVIRPKFAVDFLVKRYLSYIDEEEKEGTNLLIVARKLAK
jgi:ubiquinone/menaquinone biosynthesis C-methylase UbiE